MAGDDAGVEIVGAADAVADIEIDVAPLIEVRRRLRRCDRRGERDRDDCEDRGGGTAHPASSTHEATPLDVVPAHVRLERNDFCLNRHPALASCLSMILSENRCTLFGIML